MDGERAVRLPEHAEVGVLLLLARLRGRHPPVSAHRALELGGGHDKSQLEQLLFVFGCRDARQRPHLGVGELTPGERLVDLRQLR